MPLFAFTKYAQVREFRKKSLHFTLGMVLWILNIGFWMGATARVARTGLSVETPKLGVFTTYGMVGRRRGEIHFRPHERADIESAPTRDGSCVGTLNPKETLRSLFSDREKPHSPARHH
uniref:Uncharacterized protein n=1 Tax=Chlorobium chlorochromatii (strain CaD3) TaxID=340177 RepID=Q3AQP1_CHLCH